MHKTNITDWFSTLQDSICRDLENLDGKARFREDPWERKGGGGGRTRIIENGDLIEKGGVNFSAVFGKTPEAIIKKEGLPESDFYATGISIVLHPVNPMVPIIHMNTRYFEMGSGEKWFGGGIDLTPHYIDEADAAAFHRHLKKTCDTFDPEFYPEFKEWADKYFYIRHREETRGVGGIFYDRLQAGTPDDMDKHYAFTRAVGQGFIPVYQSLVEKNRNKPYGPGEKEWQLLRRGRYVEFNLVYDRGTRFGLETAGRTESILMSLPPHASWKYDQQPEPGSPEEHTLSRLKKDIDWINS